MSPRAKAKVRAKTSPREKARAMAKARASQKARVRARARAPTRMMMIGMDRRMATMTTATTLVAKVRVRVKAAAMTGGEAHNTEGGSKKAIMPWLVESWHMPWQLPGLFQPSECNRPQHG